MTDWQPLAGSGVPRGARLKDRAVRWSWAAVGYALPGTALAERCLRSGAEVPLGLVRRTVDQCAALARQWLGVAS